MDLRTSRKMGMKADTEKRRRERQKRKRTDERVRRGGGERWRAWLLPTLILNSARLLFSLFISPDSLRREMH